ncbi:MAG: VCBS repeat-containing protein [Gemmatimonadaceae bacterium]|nr:VCBS repeat-containing protein [Gemmatimonadaceae bacterium]
MSFGPRLLPRSFARRLPCQLALAVLGIVAACSGREPSPDHLIQSVDPPASADQLFQRLPAAVTGVRFANRVHDRSDRNVFTYRNYYNGGGVAIGDLNGDGRPEIVLTSNEEGPSLFLNEGNFHFRDVTAAAGIAAEGDSWTTGVALADVNGDGLLDIYICRAGPFPPARRANQLWINQGPDRDGVPVFKEMARSYGVADEGYSTQAVFLDYDHDGDLDLFLVNNSPRAVSSFGIRNTRDVRDPNGGAKLLRNDGGHFTDVSAAAGIHSPEIAFGLGVVVADFNRDGWPDIYVSNDFFERDYLYMNDRDGTFSEALDRQMPVLSYFSMGVDAADLDNDGWPDLYTTDMLPENEFRLKSMSTFESWEVYQTKVRNGFHHQLMRNMLQRNNHDGTFTDIGQMAGVSRTDWSWSALIADFDLDGRKDIFVSNGLAKDVTSQDYLAFLADGGTMRAATGAGRTRADFSRLIDAMTTTPIANYAFRNLGGMRFASVATPWGLATPSVSSGAAYGDLDGDGAPDLVVNNVNQEAFVYRNDARRIHPDHHYLRVRLDGDGGNRFGVGARVTAYAGADTLTEEESPVRGFQSSVDYVLDFGLGTHAVVDSVVVEWPDGRVGMLAKVASDQSIIVHQRDASARPPAPQPVATPTFTDVTATTAFDFVHHENDFVDFDREPLIPKMLSTEGPYLAVGDVNGDGLDDVFIGGAKEQPGKLLVQRRGGAFVSTDEAVFARDAISEDLGAVFFDADGDGHPDLYVVSGGNEFSDGAPALQDRLYLNDGHGHFRKTEGYLPAETESGSRVVAADYDGDGDVDLFVGGRVVPWRYGTDPKSMLLVNDGTGHFRDATAELAPELAHVGMVTDAVWRDVDGDGRPDLVVVGEWMPITVFRNIGGGRLERLAVRGLEKTEGWWNRIVATDVDGDGRVDFIVGNLGLNGRLQASQREPTTMLVKDFAGTGTVAQVLACYNNGVSYPIAMRDELAEVIPSLRSRFPRYADYARATMADLLTPAEREGAIEKRAFTFATSVVHNNGDGSFTVTPLPDEAQLAPVYGILAEDLDHDGHVDLLLAGNFEGFRPEIGRMASSEGLFLRGGSGGRFTPLPPRVSGFRVAGQARDIATLRTGQGRRIVVARNNDRPLIFRTTGAPRPLATSARPR